jgi:hypothetical protein
MKIILFKEKHYTRHFIADDKDIDNVFLKVFKERDKERYEYEIRNPDSEHLYKAARNNDHPKQAKAARLFMESRSDYEYEGCEIITPEEL